MVSRPVLLPFCHEWFSFSGSLKRLEVALLHRLLLFSLILLAIVVPPRTMPIAPKNEPKVLILSSVERLSPMSYLVDVTGDLRKAGYNVTFLKDNSITTNLITTQLDQYDVIIWRTETFELANTTYWYLGEQENQTTLGSYPRAYSTRGITFSNGILGVGTDFFSSNFAAKSLSKVKLAILISSNSISIAQTLIAAGVKTTIDFYQYLEAPFSLFDWVTESLVGYLTLGATVSDSVAKTIYSYEYVSSLDDSYLPPISFLGDGNLQIG